MVAVKPRIDFLDSLRAIAIIMVVGLHAIYYIDEAATVTQVHVFLLASIAVPIFFFVDGYLFSSLYKTKELHYRIYVVNSAKRLLIPWLLFSIIYLFIRYFAEVTGIVSLHVVKGQSIGEIIYLLYGSGISSQLYFLLSLFIIRLAAAGFYQLLRMKLIWLYVISVCYLLLHKVVDLSDLSPMPFDPLVHAFWGVQFYMLGVLAENFRQMQKSLLGLAAAMVMLSLVLLVTQSIYAMMQILLLGLTFVFAKKCLYDKQWLINIGKQTMGIYLLHMPIIIYIVMKIAVIITEITAVSIIITWFVTFVVSYLISILFHRTALGEILFASKSVSSPNNS